MDLWCQKEKIEQPKKILFLYTMTGGGHKGLAIPIKKYYEKYFPDIEFEAIDPFILVNSEDNCKFTNNLMSNWPNFYKYLCKIGSNFKILECLTKKSMTFFSSSIAEEINKKDADIIISNQPYIIQLLGQQKKKGKISSAVISNLIDLNFDSIQNFYLNDYMDAYIVATDEMAKTMVKNGIDKEKIFVVNGLPAKEDLFKEYNQKEIRKNLRIIETLPMVVIAGGAVGQGIVDEVYEKILELDMKIQIVVIAGNNEKLYNKLNKIKEQNKSFNTVSTIIRYTNSYHDYIRASDIVVSKCGSGSVAEILAIKKPLILFNDLPIVEEANLKYLIENSFAVQMKDSKHGSELVKDLIENPYKLELMTENQKKKIKSEECLSNIYKVICKIYMKISQNN
ncbi:MAG: galactosyldiacylglycerol synthase [Candidatus Paraimprobicoccus trichonymphae]|uniref:Galactosyldiacylglycerol synthase n=1 Tax=Candidatus Paraimprobicoccus trichonymphae TaxID=3033793 RepID=A0AA48HX96_9FIRM|nr:MAG: galactosyldiacylglycerol synthase [Candidatus Paraimprobicoccus trichonymphae]